MRGSVLLLLIICVSVSTPAFAQLSGLSSQIDAGDRIQVVDRNGARTDGTFESVTADALRLTVNGASRDFSGANIQEVKLRRADPKWNGVLIGGGAGALAAVIATSGNNDAEQTFYERAVFVPLFTGIGLGVGTLVDFSIKRYDTVFQATPIVSQNRFGLALRVTF